MPQNKDVKSEELQHDFGNTVYTENTLINSLKYQYVFAYILYVLNITYMC